MRCEGQYNTFIAQERGATGRSIVSWFGRFKWHPVVGRINHSTRHLTHVIGSALAYFTGSPMWSTFEFKMYLYNSGDAGLERNIPNCSEVSANKSPGELQQTDHMQPRHKQEVHSFPSTEVITLAILCSWRQPEPKVKVSEFYVLKKNVSKNFFNHQNMMMLHLYQSFILYFDQA